MAAWRAAQAKAQFSEVLDRAETEGPQLVTRRKHRYFVVSEAEMDRLKAPGVVKEKSAWEALRPPPELWGDEEFPRAPGKARPVSF